MNTFPIIILIGRPPSGKSEIIDYLARMEADQRSSRLRINKLDVLDDFPMLWIWFEEDQILSTKLGAKRLYTDEDGYFLDDILWQLLIERLSLEYQKRLRDRPGYHKDTTMIIEFSRGSEHGGYKEALEHFSDKILSQAGIVYVNVTFDEALRKNRRRFNPDRPDSILEHGLSDDKMERLYHYDDWYEFTSGSPDFLTVRGNRVPYVVFENEDDITTGRSEELGKRLETVLERLWQLRSKR